MGKPSKHEYHLIKMMRLAFIQTPHRPLKFIPKNRLNQPQTNHGF